MKPVNKSERLQEELTMREQELEFTLTKQREVPVQTHTYSTHTRVHTPNIKTFNCHDQFVSLSHPVSLSLSSFSRSPSISQLESKIACLRAEQGATREQNQRLQGLNQQLQQQLDTHRDELQTALLQIGLLQTSINQQTQGRER